MIERQLVVDVEGLALTAEDRELLMHPAIDGVILFARNYSDPQQLQALTQEIASLRNPRLQISIDQEGGRVCRIREPLPRLPSAQEIAAIYEANSEQGLQLAQHIGWMIAASMRSLGVDMSYLPVLDLDYKVNEVIGTRSYGKDPEVVTTLAKAVLKGLHQMGVPGVFKHFPGYGEVFVDPHYELPESQHSLEELESADLIPFKSFIEQGVAALMTAHVTFPKVDSLPVTFSHVWLQEILRERLGFRGLVFSDDMSMHATSGLGDMWARYHQAVEAGCDRILICNNRDDVILVLDHLDASSKSRLPRSRAFSPQLLERFYGKGATEGGWEGLRESPKWKEVVATVEEILAH